MVLTRFFFKFFVIYIYVVRFIQCDKVATPQIVAPKQKGVTNKWTAVIDRNSSASLSLTHKHTNTHTRARGESLECFNYLTPARTRQERAKYFAKQLVPFPH